MKTNRRGMLKGLLGGSAGVAVAAVPGVSKEFLLNESEAADVASGLTMQQKVAIEREIRRYVKSTGGFRKDLGPALITQATNMLAVMGRRDPVWDFTVNVPGFESSEYKHGPAGL